MRETGHKIDVAAMKEHLSACEAEIARHAAERPAQMRRRNAGCFEGRAEIALAMARIGHLFESPVPAIREVLRGGLAELPTAIDLGGVLDVSRMGEYTGAALLAGDAAIAGWIAMLPREGWQAPVGEVSDAGYLLVEAIQAGASGDRAKLAVRAKALRASLVPERLAVNPRMEAGIYVPLASLLEAAASGDQTALDAACRLQADSWRSRYGRPSRRADPDGILDVEAIGIGRIAIALGMKAPPPNPYAPRALLDGGAAG